MTEHYREYTETVKKQELLYITCDKCGAKLSDGERFEVRTFKLEFSTGFIYPGGGSCEGWQVNDLCNDCVEWIKSILTDNGVCISELERDY